MASFLQPGLIFYKFIKETTHYKVRPLDLITYLNRISSWAPNFNTQAFRDILFSTVFVCASVYVWLRYVYVCSCGYDICAWQDKKLMLGIFLSPSMLFYGLRSHAKLAACWLTRIASQKVSKFVFPALVLWEYAPKFVLLCSFWGSELKPSHTFSYAISK